MKKSVAQIVASVLIVVLFLTLFSDSKIKLGSFTTISSTDRLTDFVAVYNANLNKTIETGTTSVASITALPNLLTANLLNSASSLATVGTISSGIWNGTPITASFGGTGSTTLSLNQVLVGNGTGIMKTVSGWGTSGQLLTSAGTGAIPTWTSPTIDQAANYTLTGDVIINSASTTITNLRATSAVISGSQSPWLKKVNTNTGDVTILTSTATSTLYTTSIPQNTISTSSALIGRVHISEFEIENGTRFDLCVTYGTTPVCSAVTNGTTATIGAAANSTINGWLEFSVIGSGATNTQEMEFVLHLIRNGAFIDIADERSPEGIKISAYRASTEDSTLTKTLSVTASFTVNTGDLTSTKGYTYVIQ